MGSAERDGPVACAYCGGSLSALHHTGQGAMVHLYCAGCGAHRYGREEPPRWWTRRAWAAWIEGEDALGERAAERVEAVA